MLVFDELVYLKAPVASGFHLSNDQPSTSLFTPIMNLPNNDTVLGIVGFHFLWSSIIGSVLPSFIVGVEVVVSCLSTGSFASPDSGPYTFAVNGKSVRLKSSYDSHDGKYNSNAVSSTISISPGRTYTLTVYPTEQLEASYTTNTPLIALLGVIFAIGGTALLFGIYLWASFDLVLFNRNRERDRVLKCAADAELAEIIDAACAPIFGVGLDGKVNLWNTHMSRVSGYSAEVNYLMMEIVAMISLLCF